MHENDDIFPSQPESDTTAGPSAAALLQSGKARRQREKEEYEAQRAAKANQAIDDLLEQYRMRCEAGDRIALLQAQYLCYCGGRVWPRWVAALYFGQVSRCLDASPDPQTRKRPSLDTFLLGNRARGSRRFETAADDLRRKRAIVEAVELAVHLGIKGQRGYTWVRDLLKLYSREYGVATNYDARSIRSIYYTCKKTSECRNRQIAVTLRSLSRSLADPA
jgi:hypothetical protein